MTLPKHLPLSLSWLLGLSLAGGSVAEEPVAFHHPLGVESQLPRAESPDPRSEEIRQIAERVFGFALSSEQLDRTSRWKTGELSWWTDPEREQEAQRASRNLYLRSGGHHRAGELLQELRASADLFGIDVESDDTEAGGFVLHLEARKRPDLVSYKKSLLALLETYVEAAGDGGPDRELFHQIFPEMARAIPTDEPGMRISAESFLRDARDILARHQRLVELEQEEQILPQLAFHAQNRGVAFDEAAFEALEVADEEAHLGALNVAIDQFLEQQEGYSYPGDIRAADALLRSLIESFIPELVSTLVVPDRDARRQAAASLRQSFAGVSP